MICRTDVDGSRALLDVRQQKRIPIDRYRRSRKAVARNYGTIVDGNGGYACALRSFKTDRSGASNQRTECRGHGHFGHDDGLPESWTAIGEDVIQMPHTVQRYADRFTLSR